jgi:hypothetical protein
LNLITRFAKNAGISNFIKIRPVRAEFHAGGQTDMMKVIATTLKPSAGAFAQFRIVAITFIMSVCPPAWNSALTGRILMKFDIPAFFGNLVMRFKFHKNPTRITLQPPTRIHIKFKNPLSHTPHLVSTAKTN